MAPLPNASYVNGANLGGWLVMENWLFPNVLLLRLGDATAGCASPCVMDVKMGVRTFLESECGKPQLRTDLVRRPRPRPVHSPHGAPSLGALLTSC